MISLPFPIFIGRRGNGQIRKSIFTWDLRSLTRGVQPRLASKCLPQTLGDAVEAFVVAPLSKEVFGEGMYGA